MAAFITFIISHLKLLPGSHIILLPSVPRAVMAYPAKHRTSPSDNIKLTSSKINLQNPGLLRCMNEFEVLECMEIVNDMNIAQLYGPKGRKIRL